MSIEHLSRLLQLASPSLPVGAFSYSQGLEWAVESGAVHDATSAGAWIGSLLEGPVAGFEAPVWWRLRAAWDADDHAELLRWNDEYRASRETGELLAESVQMGHSAARLAVELGLAGSDRLAGFDPVTFPLAASFLAHAWAIPPREALAAHLWSWLENQVMAAVKVVPVGQTAAQRLLFELGTRIAEVVEAATRLTDDDLSNFAPLHAIASSRHEAQYSRLFRS